MFYLSLIFKQNDTKKKKERRKKGRTADKGKLEKEAVY